MSRNLDSPVQTQMAVAAFKSPIGSGEYHGTNRLEGKASCRRRVFVQTETGCVLGMELDRSDNAHTVKRRLQIALNFPIEESSLTFGDMILKNDLSLVKEISKAIKNGVDPIPVHGGLGGAYYFRNVRGESVAIVKPTDEEPFAPNNPKGFVGKALGQPGLKCSVRVGETGYREVAAYLLDYDHFANVPPTALVKITHSIFNVNDGVKANKPQNKKLVSKIASMQQYIPHDFDASDHGTSSFPVSAVHRIGILDIRIFNTDRHAGNLLVRKLDDVGRFGQVELIPIDHGLCLPESLEDPYFEWIHWPQSSIPFSEDELEYIKNLDPVRDSAMLRSELPMIREACLRVLLLCTIFLKEAAAYGLCLAEIGEMMSREFRSGEEEPSELEAICIEARKLIIAEEVLLSPKAESDFDEFQFDIDYEDLMPIQFGSGSVNGRIPLSKLDECSDEEEEESEGEEKAGWGGGGGVLNLANEKRVSKLSMSLKSTSLGKKISNQKFDGAKRDLIGSSSSGHRSASEQLSTSVGFVKLADMNEVEWAMFLEKFEELLFPAIAKRKSITLGQWQRQRLGTSCQF
ncbi:hypothetical protein MIMGU_mgv1a003628mg [Erythranthe guttata]|uniref:1-phosphatidylinositol 4-kinase n=1 Tax=Erythranthe guttata TaxID=4155 RepID=A0A022QLS1_ERYGU|nr:hypothetical protein MIMGU_mgv1a003628mg [Erythranthe guttata]